MAISKFLDPKNKAGLAVELIGNSTSLIKEEIEKLK